MRTAFIKLHISIFLAGFTGVFGKWISLGFVPLVWWRLLMTSVLLYLYLRAIGACRRLPAGRAVVLGGVGGLQALSWVLFYASIKLSTVSVALVCISLMGFFTAILSPLILGGRWRVREFALSGISVVGIALIFHFDTQYRLGIVLGVLSAALGSLFAIYNKKFIEDVDPPHMLFYEMFGGLALLTLLLPAYTFFAPPEPFLPGAADLGLLFILAAVLTVLLFIIELQALRKVSAFTVNLSLNLEPVYSIILAALFLGEAKEFTRSFYAGLSLILLSVVLQTLAAYWSRGADSDGDAGLERSVDITL